MDDVCNNCHIAFMRSSLFSFLSLCSVYSGTATAGERDVQDCLCHGMDQNIGLPSGAEADCLDDTRAIEVDYSYKWAEAIGQSLHYAGQTNRLATIFFVCAQETPDHLCYAHSLRLETTISDFNLPIKVEYFQERDILEACRPN